MKSGFSMVVLGFAGLFLVFLAFNLNPMEYDIRVCVICRTVMFWQG